MGSLLRNASRIRCTELRDATGAPAGALLLPPLLSRIAHGHQAAARPAVDELADAPHVNGEAELFALLERTHRTDQWRSAAAASEHRGRQRPAHSRQLGWETAARAAVRAGRPVIEAAVSSIRFENCRESGLNDVWPVAIST